jgi:exosome complex RNA-binding protein Rrp42 (RNase PH superfamily)
MKVKQLTFVDATTEEGLSTPSRVTLAYDGQGNLCAIRQDGEAEIEFAQLDSLIDVRCLLSRSQAFFYCANLNSIHAFFV